MRRRFSVRAWQKAGHVRAVPASRTAEQEADEYEAEANRKAKRFGLCQYCGANVHEAEGILHDSDCSVEASRKKAS